MTFIYMRDELKIIHDNIQRKAYQQIGSGSGRRVFDIGGGRVAKVAKNRKGLVQNRAEHHISLQARSNLLARVFHVSGDYRLLVMEKAEKVHNMSEIRAYFRVKNNSDLLDMAMFHDLSKQHQLASQDMYRAANWGKINGRPVLIDYGLTRSIRMKYYLPF